MEAAARSHAVRRPRLRSSQAPSCWVSKRARTGPASSSSQGQQLLLQRLGGMPRRDDDNDADLIRRRRWRDWANLIDGPTGLIVERVLAHDISDYVRFRAVCRTWRRCSDDPRAHSGLDRRFHPSRWTMLRDELDAPDHRCFLNTSTGECVKVHIPELHDHELLALTPEGLLVLAHNLPRATTICLLNPLTRHVIQLPPLSTLVQFEDQDDVLPERDDLSLGWEFRAWGSGIADDDSTVVLCFHKLNKLGMAKPGDDHWTLLDYDGRDMTNTPIMFEGRFYYVNRSSVMMMETGPPSLEVAAKMTMHFDRIGGSFHLVNNCGELMLVHCHGVLTASGIPVCDMYRVDLNTRTLLHVRSLGGAGRALFLGWHCSLSVSLEAFPYGTISPDTIYFTFDMYERKLSKVEAYHLADGSLDLPCRLVSRPLTLADCLSLANTINLTTVRYG